MTWIPISIPPFYRLLFLMALIASDNFFNLLEATADLTAAFSGKHLVVAFTKTVCVHKQIHGKIILNI